MSNPYKVAIGFNGAKRVEVFLVSEHDAGIIGNTVIKQSAAYNVALLDWNTGESTGTHFIVNGRNIDYLTIEEYELPS